MQATRNKNGFTLMELLAVMAVMLMMALPAGWSLNSTCIARGLYHPVLEE